MRVSEAAQDDLAGIRVYTKREFGQAQADRYNRLLIQALMDIEKNPERPGSKDREELASGFRSYRVALSIKRSGTGMLKSHHIVFYVALSEGVWGVSPDKSRAPNDVVVTPIHTYRCPNFKLGNNKQPVI
ncbi:MAG: type II toxin-antitoxin system RelE/ParE family toxin [Candidatus Hydrogenedentes bacterium]|nr:type II toxin-antitoxin system RelE/ParE family toxin [Candidatus Hydrogenedentota bacterium]